MNYMPGTASLIQDIDKKHLVLLRDGRTLIGYLRSIDQFEIARVMFALQPIARSLPRTCSTNNARRLLRCRRHEGLSKLGVAPDCRAHPRGQEVWGHPSGHLCREGRERGSAGGN
ncbi:U6 snRNA-associated Sm-like protein LSm1 isoform X2 [Chiroxiphia lanceolata]|uniref:U6 snRNA-associated Sm-like protein LSm1 isoform X2 n=1 Tax=Chiroxiphia lanceolata TaxID=296741 RepID=UPI0013CEC2D1|nr:U6 snRNA-associated Sm-like protein LSm1 isoform X2 [Chiroxiphia lanceolata]